MKTEYKRQVALLVRTIPYIARETCFALKGGTAINLFYREIPRLSVDIDLAYLGFEPREEAIALIQSALGRITQALRSAGLDASVQGLQGNQKLFVSDGATTIKVEPSYTLRGYIFPPGTKGVSPSVEEEYGYTEMSLVSPAELFGGKMCAALDRQHPRDLFDIARLLKDPSPIPDLMAGFALMLLSHNRPPVELLEPTEKDQSEVFAKEFTGMSDEPFSYADHQATLRNLVRFVHNGLAHFRNAIIAFFSLDSEGLAALPTGFERLPAIQWKLQNLEKLRSQNPGKFEEQKQKIIKYFDINEVRP